MNCYRFTSNYMKIANALEERYGSETALSFYKMVNDYVFNGVVPQPEGALEKIWEHIEGELCGNANQTEDKSAHSANWGARSLDDLSESELSELIREYREESARYNDLKKKYGLHSRSLNEPAILCAEGKLRKRMLQRDPVLLEELACCSDKTKKEWLENIPQMNVTIEQLRTYLDEFPEPEMISEPYISVLHPEGYEYWSAVAKEVRSFNYSLLNK